MKEIVAALYRKIASAVADVSLGVMAYGICIIVDEFYDMEYTIFKDFFP